MTRNIAKYAAPTLFCTAVASIMYPTNEIAVLSMMW